MRAPTGVAILGLVGAFPILATAQTGRSPASDSLRKAPVTGVTLGTIYLGAGRNDGLKEGTRVWIPRLGEQAVYSVAYLSSKSAAARGDSLAPLPVMGDTVLYRPALGVPAAGARNGVAQTGSRRSAGTTLRGRVGLRYLGSWDRSGDVVLRQPGFELLLNGPIAPGGPVGINVDVRSRRTSLYRPGADATTNGTMGVYQAALRFQAPKGSLRAIIGRQYAPTLAGVGLFDGVLIDYQKSHWGAGVTAGLEPELGTLAFSPETRQVGVFFQGRSRLNAPVRWGLTVGGMGSYTAGSVNREFGFLQGSLGSRVFSALVLQELDFNRGWKIEAGEPRFSLTSTFLSLNLNPAPGVSLSGGFDSRRNVRLYRDLSTPEELFDDRFRTGYWGAANFTIAKHLRLGADVRTNNVAGADSLTTTAWSGTMSADQLTAWGFGFRFRGTRYQTPIRGPGTLLSGGLRVAPGSFGSLELNGGTRREKAFRDSDRFWAGLDLEVFVQRSWFFLVTFTREWGRAGLTPTTDLLYGGLSYRF